MGIDTSKLMATENLRISPATNSGMPRYGQPHATVQIRTDPLLI